MNRLKQKKPKAQVELDPIVTKESWSKGLKDKIQELIEQFFIEPLLDVTKETKLDNAKVKTLAQLIRAGEVWYDGLYFRGKRSVALSKELRAMGATFSKAQGAWRLEEHRLPYWLYDTIVERKEQAKALQSALEKRLSEVQKKLMDIVPKLSFDVEAARQDRALQKEMQRTVPNAMAVQPSLDDEQKKFLDQEYSKNVALSIKGFVDSEVLRFRDKVIPKIQSGMDRRELRSYVEKRLGVSRDRAKFIARQETSLYVSNLKEAGYRKAGIEKYRWKAIGGKSGDGRTRDEHKAVHGKVFFWDKAIGEDGKTRKPVNADGVPVNPSIDFGCRCVAVPIVDEL